MHLRMFFKVFRIITFSQNLGRCFPRFLQIHSKAKGYGKYTYFEGCHLLPRGKITSEYTASRIGIYWNFKLILLKLWLITFRVNHVKISIAKGIPKSKMFVKLSSSFLFFENSRKDLIF